MNRLRASLIRLLEKALMLNVIMRGLGFAGQFVYLVAYFSLTHGWISGAGYVFHGSTVVGCTMVA